MTETCMNCRRAIEGKPSVFQGVVICSDCFMIVSHVVKRAQTELRLLFLTYTDLLRVALVKGELRPPVLPDGKTMPKEVFFNGLAKVREALRDHTKIQTGEG